MTTAPSQPTKGTPSRWIDGLARVLLCLVFVQSLLGKFGGFSRVATMMGERGIAAAPLLLASAMVMMGVGSALVISGWRSRLGALLLLLFLLPTTFLFHGDVADAGERIQFFKNLSIVGGLLLVANRNSPRR